MSDQQGPALGFQLCLGGLGSGAARWQSLAPEGSGEGEGKRLGARLPAWAQDSVVRSSLVSLQPRGDR